MNEYVLCHVTPDYGYPNQVLLIEKRRPAWQAGLYNLPGGAVEEGETVHEAAVRELFEETGLKCNDSDVMLLGTIDGGQEYLVYVCDCAINPRRNKKGATTVTDEVVFWSDLHQALNDPRLISNLRIIIPFCRSRLKGWSIAEDYEGRYVISNEALNENSQVS
jgi:8-oxo-dGTP pyrophosphatase MutT (NUDIX family)